LFNLITARLLYQPHPSPERSSPTRLSMSGQPSYKGWPCITFSKALQTYRLQADGRKAVKSVGEHVETDNKSPSRLLANW